MATLSPRRRRTRSDPHRVAHDVRQPRPFVGSGLRAATIHGEMLAALRERLELKGLRALEPAPAPGAVAPDLSARDGHGRSWAFEVETATTLTSRAEVHRRWTALPFGSAEHSVVVVPLSCLEGAEALARNWGLHDLGFWVDGRF